MGHWRLGCRYRPWGWIRRQSRVEGGTWRCHRWLRHERVHWTFPRVCSTFYHAARQLTYKQKQSLYHLITVIHVCITYPISVKMKRQQTGYPLGTMIVANHEKLKLWPVIFAQKRHKISHTAFPNEGCFYFAIHYLEITPSFT